MNKQVVSWCMVLPCGICMVMQNGRIYMVHGLSITHEKFWCFILGLWVYKQHIAKGIDNTDSTMMLVPDI